MYAVRPREKKNKEMRKNSGADKAETMVVGGWWGGGGNNSFRLEADGAKCLYSSRMFYKKKVRLGLNVHVGIPRVFVRLFYQCVCV